MQVNWVKQKNQNVETCTFWREINFCKNNKISLMTFLIKLC